MEDSAGATTLTNSGVHTSATADLTGGSFVKVGLLVDFSHTRFSVGDLGMHVFIHSSVRVNYNGHQMK